MKLPNSLDCTGLFDSMHDKSVSKSVVAFVPAYPLWSDGADKHRWIQLPKGTKINNAKPNDWVFPVGTKLWKEFRVDGKRIETRLFWKVRSDRWEKGTYAWNADESAAELSRGGDIEIEQGTYHLPTLEECDDCHRGQPDRVLGFSAVNLGLDGADGVTLAKLVEDGWLTEEPDLTELSIGADETGVEPDGVPLAAKALGVLHTNCGLTCHNQSPNAKANLTSQNLRLDMTMLDGRPPDMTFNVLRTAIAKRAEGVQWDGRPYRISPGDPDNSLIVQLMSHRDPSGMGRGQMPPIGTREIDEEGLAIVRKWVSLLSASSEDAGEPDGGSPMDAATPEDAAMDAAETPDTSAPMDAASEVDAGEIDAGADAEIDAGADAEIDATVEPDAASDSDAGSDAEVDAASDPDASAPDV